MSGTGMFIKIRTTLFLKRDWFDIAVGNESNSELNGISLNEKRLNYKKNWINEIVYT